MCNLYTQTASADEIARLFAQRQVPLRFPEGVPNLTPRDIAITDPAPIVRAVAGRPGEYELVVRRWSWSGPSGRPVYNFRSEGREFASGRCLVVADGFYEFTVPADAKQKRKDRWLFRWPDSGVIAMAGLVREVSGSGEAFTILTTEPGDDVKPYHSRQVALLPPADWQAWLDHSVPARELLRPLAGGTLTVAAAAR